MAEREYFSRLPRALLVVGVIVEVAAACASVSGIPHSGPRGLLLSAGFVWGAWLFAVGLRNRRRPVLRVTEAAIEFGSSLSLRTTRLPRAEILELVPGGWVRVRMRARDGRVVGVPLAEIPRAKREEARAALERWVGAFARAG